MTSPTESLALSERSLLEPAELDLGRINRVLDGLLKPGIDAADLYFQGTQYESWMLEDGIIKTGTHDAGRGVGVRVCSQEKSGFAYSDEISLPALDASSQAVAAIARQGQQSHVQAWAAAHPAALYKGVSPLGGWTTEEKLSILRRVDLAARAADPHVTQVIATLAGSFETVLVAAADGTLAADLRPLVRLSVNVIAERNGRREQASSGAGGRGAYADFFSGDAPERLAKEAVRQVGVALQADPAPAGSMTVVLGPGWPGVLLHEAIGHGLEGDFNRKGTSAFSGRIGELVANPLCTVVDDGTMPNRRGSLTLDDEGTPSQCTTLIENGVLKGYIQDKLNARLMGVKPTGNGRRESYAHLPMPRMTNTYMLPGPHEREEIIRSVKKGLYAVNFAGGQVDITSGNFVFSASEAYLIEDGKVTRPVKGATLIGNGPEVLTRVTMVGNDLELDPGIGVCGKDGQSVPVGVGQPTLKIEGLTVGGTQGGMIRLEFETTVAAAPDEVWSRVSTMQGVNAELMPILRMTYPPALSNLDAAPEHLLGKLAFKSWILLGGLLPVDRHFLSLASVTPGKGFDERSSSWSQRIWVHRRTLTSTASGTTIRDELEFEPRLTLAAPLLRWFITRVFSHRHRQLQRQFGRVP